MRRTTLKIIKEIFPILARPQGFIENQGSKNP